WTIVEAHDLSLGESVADRDHAQVAGAAGAEEAGPLFSSQRQPGQDFPQNLGVEKRSRSRPSCRNGPLDCKRRVPGRSSASLPAKSFEAAKCRVEPAHAPSRQGCRPVAAPKVDGNYIYFAGQPSGDLLRGSGLARAVGSKEGNDEATVRHGPFLRNLGVVVPISCLPPVPLPCP